MTGFHPFPLNTTAHRGIVECNEREPGYTLTFFLECTCLFTYIRVDLVQWEDMFEDAVVPGDMSEYKDIMHGPPHQGLDMVAMETNRP